MISKSSRASLTAVALSLGTALLAAAPSATSAVAEPQGELTVVIPSFGRELLDLGRTGTNDLQFTGHINEPLIGETPAGDIAAEGGLTEAWQISDDAKTFTLKLRSNVRWHDGKPFTADDVVFSLAERYVAKDAVCTVCNILRVAVEKVEAVDPQTVRITLKRPEVTFLSLLSARDGDIRILARHAYRPIADGFELIGDPIGTGPWKFISFERSVALRLAANADYWDKNRIPEFATLRLLPRAQASTRLSMVRANEADMALLDPNQIVDAKAANLRVISVPQMIISVSFLGCWQTQMLCHEQAFREALVRAVDVDAIIKRIYPDGTAKRLATSFWSEKALGYDPALKPYAYDPNRAKELLKQINYSGAPVKLWQMRLAPEAAEIMELVDGYLRASGIKTELTPIEFSAWRPRLVASPQNFETTYAAHFYIDPSAARVTVLPAYRIAWISQQAGGLVQQYWNLQKSDSDFAKLTQITNLESLDKELRRLNRETYLEYPSIPLATRSLVAAVGPRVKDWTPSAYGFALHFEKVKRN